MKSTFRSDDVELLLKDITGLVEPMENAEREKCIQSGVHYCEMIPKEHLPSEKYLKTFYDAVARYSVPTAKAVEILTDKILADKGRKAVIVSLARAGTPIGILIKHCAFKKHGIKLPHYSISIIRGRGIDKNALNYILKKHNAESIQFLDGWTGKGAIQNQLSEALKEYQNIDHDVAVLSDPAYIAGMCGTHNDFLIPSSCLNSTISGLISRTFLRDDIIGPNDFHGAMYYGEFEKNDLTYYFIDSVTEKIGCDYVFKEERKLELSPIEEVRKIADNYGISDINFVKPGVGETTRVLLRRIPYKILVHSFDDNYYLGHIYQLAKEKKVTVEVYPFKYYRCCGLIKKMADT